jgi:EAL domain-containing protein (putative c-di-GMP-specific phosphodiesterase class I)
VSVGVSVFPRDGNDMGELLRHSDTAMYQAKDRGRNNYQLFSPSMDRKLKERIAIETSLRVAMQNHQLDVHYQPIIDIQSNHVVALEALLRWKHPTHGFVPPERFIAVAEETGLIVPIGDFVLERVVQDLVRWGKNGCSPAPVAVNISAVQLQRSNLPQTILELTRKHSIKPSMLQLELTESAVFERREGRTGESNEDAVSRLRELGVKLAIDDFGTGYSSLSYLKRWRVDYLKIDRSFVRDLVTDMSDLAIVGAIIAMARHLNIQVVAEGIEGWQQLEKLRHLGCGLAQGYLFAKAAPHEQCRRFLTGVALDLTETDPLVEALEATGNQRLATGLARATAIECKLTVASAMTSAMTAAPMNIHPSSLMWYVNPCSQRFIASAAMGHASRFAHMTGLLNCHSNIVSIAPCVAPIALRTPISFVRLSAVNDDSPSSPRQERATAIAANSANRTPCRVTSAYLSWRDCSRNRRGGGYGPAIFFPRSSIALSVAGISWPLSRTLKNRFSSGSA